MQLIIDTENEAPARLVAVARFLLALSNPGCAEAPDTSATEAAAAPCDKKCETAGKVGGLELRVNVDTTAAQQAIASLAAAADRLPEQLRQQLDAHVAPVEQDDAYAVFTAGETTPAPAAATPAPDITPSAPISSAPTSPGSVELDSAGLPWDARIHASTRTKLKGDGTWKLKRGVHDHEVERVTAELRAIMSAGPASTAEAPAGPSVTHTPPAGQFPTPPGSGMTTQAPAGQPAPTPTALDFAGLMQRVTAAQTAGKLTPTAIMDAVRSVGLNALPDLIHRPDLVPAVGDKIQQLTGGA